MRGHVDIVENRPQDGQQVLIAQVRLVETAVSVEARASNEYQHLEVVPYFLDGREIVPTEEPELYLAELNRAMDGDYVFATSVHSEAACKFKDAKELAFKTMSNHPPAGASRKPRRRDTRLRSLGLSAKTRRRSA